MGSEIAYMLGVVAAGFAVNFGLRALPFVFFGHGKRELPKAVEKLGAFVSPVIIACLIVYSYASLEWRTAAPYIAGGVTIALELWKKNPLLAIISGTLVYMALLWLQHL